MKIISKFKDYYDYLLGKYGSDPKCVFDRTKKIETAINHQLDFNCTSCDQNLYDPDHIFNYRLLVICGKYYPLIAKGGVTKSSNFRLITESDLEDDRIYKSLKMLLPINTGWFAKKKSK